MKVAVENQTVKVGIKVEDEIDFEEAVPVEMAAEQQEAVFGGWGLEKWIVHNGRGQAEFDCEFVDLFEDVVEN